MGANDTRKLAAIEAKIAEQQSREKAAGGTVESILDGLDKLLTGEMSGADFNKQITGPLSSVEKAFSGQAMGFHEGMDLFRKIKSGDPLIAGRVRTKTEEIAKQRGIDPANAGAMKLIREEVMGNLSRNLGGAGSAIAEQLGMPELAGIIEQELSRMFEAEDQAAMLGNEMRDVGREQVGIMQQMLSREEALMATVLNNADEGFNTAVNNFERAVQEFAMMRGGISDDEISLLSEDTNKAKAKEQAAFTAYAEAVGAQEKQITEAGDAAAEAERKKLKEEGVTGPEAEQRIDAARQTAQDEERRRTDKDITQKKHKHNIAKQDAEEASAFEQKIRRQKQRDSSRDRATK